MRAFTIVSAATVVAALSACGGNGNGGNGPSETVTSLSISPGTSMLKIKGTETFTAIAKMSNGTSKTVSATWRTSNPSVASIDEGGRATALTSGTTTITAEYQNVPAPRNLRVVPDYQGTWRGRLNVVGCTDDGDWHAGDFCKDLGTGEVDDIALTASQQDAAITGTLDVGGMAGPITGSIAGDGTLAVAGEYTVSAEGVAVKIGIAEWQSVTADNARMTGRMTFTMRNDMMSGTGRVQTELVNMNKTSSSLLARAGGFEGRLFQLARTVARRH